MVNTRFTLLQSLNLLIIYKHIDLKFLQTLLIILLIYFALRFIFKLYGKQMMAWAGRKFMQRMARKMQKGQGAAGMNFEDLFRQAAAQQQQSKKKSNPQVKKKEEVVGEYVDYEEID